MQKRHLLLLSLTVFITIILTGCFRGEQSLEKSEIDSPPESEVAEDQENKEEKVSKQGENEENEENEEKDEAEDQSVNRQLYLLDADGMVAPQTIELPKPESHEVAKQSLEYLVKDGPVSSLLPNGFQAVLPAGTEIKGLDINDKGTITVNVSEEFENYQAKEEREILEAMTYTVTQFDNVDNMKLRVDGDPKETMPVDGTPISNGYSRTNGINLVQSNAADFINSEPVTLYYPSVQGDNNYIVPVTEHIDTEDNSENMYESMVQALIEGPALSTNLQQVFDRSAELANDPSVEDGVLEMVFNQDVLMDEEEAVISNDVMETLVRTMTQAEDVEAVEVEVEDVETLFSEEGEPYTEPVSLQTFSSTEKL